MSDEVQPVEAPASRADAINSAWEASQTAEPEASDEAAPAEAPLTKADLDEKPESAAPSIREFLKAQRPKPEPEGLEREVQELRAALDHIRNAGKQPDAPKSEQERILAELEHFRNIEAERLAAAQQAQEEAAYEERVQALREGAVANLKARKESYPALFALGQEDTVINELFNRLSNDQDVSEEDIASEVEGGLREVWEKLNPIFATQSKATPARSESQTISNALAGADEELDTAKMSRQERIDYAWQRARTS